MLKRNTITPHVTSKQNKKSAPDTEDFKTKENMAMLDNKYLIEKSAFGREKYLYRHSKKESFRDKGDKLLVSNAPNSYSAKDLVLLMQAKGWGDIKVSGKTEFKRELWLEASSKGFKVSGYKPTKQDLRMLDNVQTQAKASQKQSTSFDTVKKPASIKTIAKEYAQYLTDDPEAQKKIQIRIMEEASERKAARVVPSIAKQPTSTPAMVKAATPSQSKQVAHER